MRGLLTLISISLVVFLTSCTGADNIAPFWPQLNLEDGGIIHAIAGDQQVTVTWHEAVDVDHSVEYLVFHDTDDNPFDQVPVVIGMGTLETTIFSLVNGTEYWFGVWARDTGALQNVASNSNTRAATPSETDTQPPLWDDTTGIQQLDSLTQGQLQARWKAATDYLTPPVYYLVYVDTDDNPWDQVPLETQTATPDMFLIDGLTPGETYWVGVRVRDSVDPPNIDDNTVVLSETVVHSGVDDTPPVWDDTIGIVSLTPGDSQLFALWNSATDAETPPAEYFIYIDTDNNPWNQTPYGSTTCCNPFPLNGLTNGQEYWVGVRCADSMSPRNFDENTVVLSAIPVEGPPDTTAPAWNTTVGITSLVAGDGMVSANWGSATDAESPPVYYLVYGDVDDNPWDVTPTEVFLPGNPYVIDTLTNGMEYWVGVRCRDSNSPPNVDTNTVVLSAIPTGGSADTIPPDWAGDVIITANSDPGMVYVEWGDATDLDSPPVTYLVYLDSSSPPWDATPVEKLASEHWHMFTGVASGYWYVGVRASDSASPPNIDKNTDIWGLDVQ